MSGEFSNLKILVVEDNESNIMFFKSAFKRTGATLITTKYAEQAIEFVKTTPDIDIILMDINLPKMDGITAMKEIKKIVPDTPLIIQTAYVLDYREEKCYQAGCDFFIEKPIRLATLYDTIAKLVNKN